MSIAPKTIQLPSRAAWDFDLDGCPPDELEHCLFYEYALESPLIKNLVTCYRKNCSASISNDRIGDLVADHWFGSPFRVLAEHPEFPKKHWLEIDTASRRAKIKRLPPYFNFRFPDTQKVKYSGPRGTDMMRLKAEHCHWQWIKAEQKHLREELLSARDNPKMLRAIPVQWRAYLGKKKTSYWKRKLATLEGAKLIAAADALLRECNQGIERLRRRQRELVIYEIDWTLRPKELKEHFAQWAEVNRVHDPRQRKGGHSTEAVELLRALGAKRLLKYFQTGNNTTDYVSLDAFVIGQRKAANRTASSLYTTRQGWIDAETRAREFIERFQR